MTDLDLAVMEEVDRFVEMWIPKTPYYLVQKAPLSPLYAANTPISKFIPLVGRVYLVNFATVSPLFVGAGQDIVFPTTVDGWISDDLDRVWLAYCMLHCDDKLYSDVAYIEGKRASIGSATTIEQLYAHLELPMNLAKFNVSKIYELIFGKKMQGYLASLASSISDGTIGYVNPNDPKGMNAMFPPSQTVIDRSKIGYTKECVYSITPPYKANLVIDRLAASPWVKKPINELVVTDGTSSCGGFVLNLAPKFKMMNAVEIDPLTFGVLSSNVKLYGLTNVKLINADYTKIMTTLQQDVVILDPPWTGPNYKEIIELPLSLGGIDISSIVNTLKPLTSIIILKVPLNFALDKFKVDARLEKGGLHVSKAENFYYLSVRGFR